MKNIHILPTDKSSKLIHNDVNQLCYQSNKSFKNDRKWMYRKKFNIYITSDEEIKKRDIYLHISNDINSIEYKTINVCHKPHRKQDDEWYVDGMYSNKCKKIILSTDQDLIKDGVQAIPDEFLEWFVKNPSCEKVKLENHVLELGYNHYKIIIPKEQPKQYTSEELKEFEDFKKMIKPKQEPEIICYCGHTTYCDCSPLELHKEEPKQELNCFDCNKSLKDCTCIEDTIDMKKETTLEEAAERLYSICIKPILDKYDDGVTNIIGEEDINEDCKDAFYEGAKWQMERSYSEEDLREAFKGGGKMSWTDINQETQEPYYYDFNDWFEQFKKKNNNEIHNKT
jgi:hypothetical protein